MADDESIVKIKTEGDPSGAEKVEKAVEKTGDAAEKAAEKTEKAAEKAEKAIEKTGDAAEKAAEKTEKAAEKAEKAIEKTGDASEKAAEKAERASNAAADASSQSANRAAGAWERFSGAVGKCKSVIGTFMGALSVVGFAIQGVQLVISTFQKLKDWLDRDKKTAEELARQIQDQKTVAAVEAAAKAYEKLNAKVAETLRLEKERDRLADQKLSQERAAEDAQTELEMQQELAGLDRNDPDFVQKAELVRSKYTRIRSARAVERARADRVTQQTRLQGAADEKEEQAAALENQVYEGSAGERVIALKGLIHDEKDDERRKKLEGELEQMVAEQKRKLAEAKKMRDEAASLRREAENLFGADRAAMISNQAVNIAQDAADEDTRRQMEQNRTAREDAAREAKRKADEAAAKEAAKAAQAAADKETVANGKSELEGLQLNADAARARAQAAADSYAKEQGDVVAAQNRYDMLVQNGGSRKEKSAALAALQKEKAEAQEAQHEMEKVAAEVANVLQGINAQIKTLANAVQKAESRLGQNQTDAPEG